MQSESIKPASPMPSPLEIFAPSEEPTSPSPNGSSREVSPAKIFPSLVKALGFRVSALGSGTSMPELLASYDRVTRSWKTSELSLFGDSILYSGALPRSGTMRNGRIYAPPMSERPIEEREFGWWPTPTKSEGTGPGAHGSGDINLRTAVQFPTPSATEYGSNQGGGMGRTGPSRPSLGTMARKGLWPTPRAHERGGYQRDRGIKGKERPTLSGAAKMWPTPTANRRDGLQSHGVNVVSGSLNPAFVEWLMGYPLGWTDLNVSGIALSRR
jgi:hypothetical protein